ncbi:hypothetical protein LCGC14_0473340 [marine sediment metagenome]|uniref:Uncharacterized protein n=1 Tax=marine sediment metagenome TaxID=412755 RepID=A0A0F9SGR3_9ZZZZ
MTFVSMPNDMELHGKCFNLCCQIFAVRTCNAGFDSSAGGFPLYDGIPTRAFGG